MNPIDDAELTNLIRSRYPDDYYHADTLPEAYQGKGKIKAIIIGADPTYEKDNGKLKVVFGLENPNSPFFRSIHENIKTLGLTLDNIYVQNLIKSYFTKESSKNKIWKECATLSMENLKRELDAKFPRTVPMLITAEIILKVLVYNEHIKGIKPKQIYSQNLTFPPEQNFFGRNVIALYRHHEYKLDKWPDYAFHIKTTIGKRDV